MDSQSGEQSSKSLLSEITTLESFLYNLAEGVIVADRQGRFLFCNQAARSILGTNGNAPETWSEVCCCYRPDKVTPYPPHEMPLAQALAGAVVRETEIFVLNPERPVGVWILAEGTPLWDESGQLRGGVLVFRDITSQKEAEQSLRMLTNAVEQTADSIVITDRNGLIEYVNPAFQQTTGYAQADVLGRTPRILKSGIHDDEFYKNLWATISSGMVFRGTIANRRKNGETYYAEQTITPMRDNTGDITHFVSVIKDITEQRKLREQEFNMSLARAVQQRFYSILPPQVDGFDIAGAAFPADAIGGDHFDFVSLPGAHVGISIGDVSGHGVASALLMVELRACLRAFAQKTSDVGEILTLVNSALLSDLEENQYATLAFYRLHPASRRFVYANAGHPPGYILDADGTVKQTLDSIDIPLGMFRRPAFACSRKIKLEPGDTLALLTDGILEAQGRNQVEFGAERALAVIRTHRTESARQIVAALHQAVRDFSDGQPQVDDITAIICKSVGKGISSQAETPPSRHSGSTTTR